MNANRNQLIMAGVAGLVLVAVVAYQFLGGNSKDAAYLANFEKSKQQNAAIQAAEGVGGPVAPAVAPGAQAVAAPGTGVSPKGPQGQINIDQLLTGIQTNVFSFDAEQRPRDPMRPLVGPTALREVAPTGPTGSAEPGQPRALEAIARGMRVTGIVWDKYKPVAVVENEVVWPGYEFPQGIVVQSIEPKRVNLKVQDSVIPIELEGK